MIAFTMMGTVASQVTATATIINMLGGEIGISYEMGAFIACAVFIIYTATSGLFGVIYTDVFQFIRLILFVYILIPGRIAPETRRTGRLFSAISRRSWQLPMSMAISSETLLHILCLRWRVRKCGSAPLLQRVRRRQRRACSSAPSCTVSPSLSSGLWEWSRISLSAEIRLPWYGTTDAVVPALAIEILPIGLTGLALAGILSVIMSTADSYLIVSVQSCVHDVYKSFKPDVPEKKELILTRVFAVIMPLGALLIALYIKNAYNILMFAWSFYAAAAGLPAFAALYWKKATTAGILSGMVVGFTVCIGWKLAGQPLGLGATVPGALACAAALVIVSLATYKRSPTPFLNPYAEAVK